VSSPRLSDRAFGLGLFAVLLVVTLARWLFFGEIGRSVGVAAGAFLAAAVFAPSVLMPVNRLMEILARRVGVVSNYVVLGSFLWLVITPIGFVMRVAGYDPMHRRFDSDRDSYLTPVEQAMTWERFRDVF
jgi:hypothetical protein